VPRARVRTDAKSEEQARSGSKKARQQRSAHESLLCRAGGRASRQDGNRSVLAEYAIRAQFCVAQYSGRAG
jgi:hypothetical protein